MLNNMWWVRSPGPPPPPPPSLFRAYSLLLSCSSRLVVCRLVSTWFRLPVGSRYSPCLVRSASFSSVCSSNLCTALLLGRPGVGKSSLFNAFLRTRGKRKAKGTIQESIIGNPSNKGWNVFTSVTRDVRRSPSLSLLDGVCIQLMDSAGVIPPPANTELQTSSTVPPTQVWLAAAAADVVLLVVDASQGLTPADEILAQRVNNQSIRNHSGEKTQKVILVVNKFDLLFSNNGRTRGEEEQTHCQLSLTNDLYGLNLGHPVYVSALEYEGLDDLVERLTLDIRSISFSIGGALPPSSGSYSLPPSSNALSVDSLLRETHTNPHWLTPGDEAETEHRSDVEEELLLSSRRWMEEVDSEAGVKSSSSAPALNKREEKIVEKRSELLNAPLRLVVIGRPNSGKSTLVNGLLRAHRQAVASETGTTHDAVELNWSWRSTPIQLVDTPGVVKGWRYDGSSPLTVEAGLQTLRHIRTAHVCVLCIDATAIAQGSPLSHHELTMANLVGVQEGKCLAIAVTKLDLVSGEKGRAYVKDKVMQTCHSKMSYARGCPIVFVSGTQRTNLDILMNKIIVVYRRWNKRVSTSRLNTWMRAFTARWPPPWKHGAKCDILFACQPSARPPTLVLWNSSAQAIPPNYVRQLVTKFREEFNMAGTPIRVRTRTSCMPQPGKKLTKKDILKWKRLGPKQAAAVVRRSAKGGPLYAGMPRKRTALEERRRERERREETDEKERKQERMRGAQYIRPI